MSNFPKTLLDAFSNSLIDPQSAVLNAKADPCYFAQDPSTLNSAAAPLRFTIGTGADIYAHHAGILLSAESSLTIVTCFWARSKSLDTLNDVLRKLSTRSLATNHGQKLRVRICFSSLSVTQKLFHPRSTRGKTWPSSTWKPKLGLPDPSELTGLDLKIKSIFILPFSVMHPKFIIIDRKTVLLPSCNVSWEDWLEGCIHLSGDIVQQFTRFYDAFWSDTPDQGGTTMAPPQLSSPESIPCIFLPSPHHANPKFHPLPFTAAPIPPPTPLNTFLLTAIAHATKTITITTPNLTCAPLITALLASLTTGVNITIYTSRRMMLLEQLLTAGTTTEFCVWRMKRRYRKLLLAGNATSASSSMSNHSHTPIRNANVNGDTEAQRHLGQLRVYYFNPTSPSITATTTDGSNTNRATKLHFKSTIIDDHVVVLGSGNMDRASWYTLQELGVAFASTDLAAQVQAEFQAFLARPEGGRHLTQVI